MRSAVLAVLVACGGSTPVVPEPTPSPKPPAQSPELSAYLQRYNWLLGSWAAGDEQQSWIAVDGAIFGIALHPGGAFDLTTIDDGEGRDPADNVLRIRFMANGEPAPEKQGPPGDDGTLEFGGATYLHLGAGLSVQRGGATLMFKHVAPPYITVWHRVGGAWKVFRDTGRVVNSTL